MTNEEQLLRKFADSTITPEEAARFWEGLHTLSPPALAALEQQYANLLKGRDQFPEPDADMRTQLLDRIQRWEKRYEEFEEGIIATPVVHRIHFLRTNWFRYAALLLLIAGTATYLYIRHEGPPKEIVHNQPTTDTRDIQPGGNKAILTLSDGSTVVLDSAANGALASQGNTQIIKLSEGALAYQGSGASEAAGFNTISTPNGGQYQVVLPDGTKVWLNAASSITFPTAFASDRNVTVTGEVYLEVAPAVNQPFTVAVNDQRIQVLGTSFNINAYKDEARIRTTLFTGRVRVSGAHILNSLVLQPGQQAVVNSANNQMTLNNQVNLQQVIAWKNGFFSYEDADIATVLRQLSRWYDLDVQYAGAIPTRTFTGKIGRMLTLQQVLSLLSEARIQYTLNNKTLTILPSSN